MFSIKIEKLIAFRTIATLVLSVSIVNSTQEIMSYEGWFAGLSDKEITTKFMALQGELVDGVKDEEVKISMPKPEPPKIDIPCP